MIMTVAAEFLVTWSPNVQVYKTYLYVDNHETFRRRLYHVVGLDTARQFSKTLQTSCLVNT